MIQGTGSGVGKSFLTAGLCRILSDQGIRVAPFKAQNMALNSFVTADGGEIGRAQAFQAEAARVEPETNMNPVLLKAESESGCQVILNGRVHGSMSARAYYGFHGTAWPAVRKAYDALASRFDVIVMEGAGSPAEINLSDREIVNMNMARYADAPVLLVGDIDKGGVFASLYGTLALLDQDAGRIRAFIINKFRGDKTILDPGLDLIREKTGRPVIGVLPHLGDLGMHEEDGIPFERLRYSTESRSVRIAVVQLKWISNFTDFDPFFYEPDVEVLFTRRAEDILNADIVIVPGSKNTVHDLAGLRESGLADAITEASASGTVVIGLCGGYQMLGRRILDPNAVESTTPVTDGLGLLDTVTTLDTVKTTRQVRATVTRPLFQSAGPMELSGYEIHMGRTETPEPLFTLYDDGRSIPDGSQNGSVWGTYLHGLFDNDEFRRNLIDSIRVQKNLAPLGRTVSYARLRDEAIDRWADTLRSHLDMDFVLDLLEVRT